MVHVALVVLTGFLIGGASGILGVGGGIFLVPVLTVGFGLPQRVAQGTSLATILPTALVGAITHHRAGNVVRRAALWIGLGGAFGAVVGSAIALQLPHAVLARGFGTLLLLAAWRMWQSAKIEAGRSSPSKSEAT